MPEKVKKGYPQRQGFLGKLYAHWENGLKVVQEEPCILIKTEKKQV